MHRPPSRTIRAAILASVIGMLGTTDHIKNIFTPSARVGRRSSVAYPRQSDREKLRRRIGGFAKLHDHEMHFVSHNKTERRCQVCDRGVTI